MGVRKQFVGAAVVSLLGMSSPARAQSTASEGWALDIYEPTPAGDALFTVPSATVPKGLTYSDKLVGSLSYRPTLRRLATNGDRVEIVSSAFYLHASSSLAIADRFLVNLNAPFALVQSSDLDGSAAPGFAFGDLRLTGRVNVLGEAHDAFSLALMQSLWLPTGSEDDFTGDGRLRSNAEVVMNGRVGLFFYGVDVGYLSRKTISDTVDIGGGLTFGAGAGVLLLEDSLQIALEMNGTAVIPSGSSDRSMFGSLTTPVSGLLGIKYRVKQFVFGVATGPGMSESPGVSPHVAFSIAYAPKGDDEASSTARDSEEAPVSETPAPAATMETPPAAPPTPADAPTPASAPTPAPPVPAPAPAESEEEKTARARALFHEGVSHFDARRYEEARKAFAAAYDLRPHPTVLLNLAQSELDSGHHADACKHFKQWQTEQLDPPKEKLEAVKAGIAETCR